MAQPDPPRPLAAGDACALARLHASSFERGWNRDDFAALLAAGAWGFGLAGAGQAPDPGCLSGFVLVQGGLEPEVVTIAVHPQMRRRGLGRTLIVAAAAAACRAGAPRLTLEVALDNAPAEALYHSLGFKPVGLRRGYYERAQGRVDARVLAASLPLADRAATRGLDRT